mmetsp:Transcript_20254/g.26286  ORF Transcript_20254/g.26286 Transcript_20254/m.26286 type:complete len:398 (-) Transcript_20254:100-1293(-)
MTLDIALTVEVAVAVIFLLFVSRHPRCGSLCTVVLAVLCSYALFGLWALGPFEKVVGSEIVGQKRMSAVVFAPEESAGIKLDTVDVPDHNNKQVLIEVKAAGLNPSNYKFTIGSVPFLRHVTKHVVGYDVSGIVRSVGSDPSCKGLKVGDDVYGMAATGSIAEFSRAQCSTVAHKPKTLTYIQAASLPVVALTSLEAYRKGSIKPNDNVLVIGASGGCGIYGVTLAEKVFNARATGICSTKNVEFVKALGASSVVDYKSQDSMQSLISSGKQFDIIYDTVSSFDPVDPDYEPSMAPLLKPGGKYVAINGWISDWWRCFMSRVTVPLFGFDVHRPNYELFLLTPTSEMLETLASLFDSKKLTEAPIAATFKLDSNDSVEKAFEKMKSRRTVGKIVFEF